MSLRWDEALLRTVRELSERPRAVSGLTQEINRLSEERGVQAAYNYLLQAEVMLNLRRPSLAIYDHAFHFIGGAQKYGLTLTSALKDRFEITIIANKDVSQKDFLAWYNLDLSGCRVKVIKLPFFEDREDVHLDPALISKQIENPFHAVSKESGNYDVFVNNSMNEMVCPLSNISVLVCHFPERRPQSYFYADKYTSIICNSRYTAEWIAKKWKVTPHEHIYPPVDMEGGPGGRPKKNIILSVARYEPEGSKRQLEMIGAFLRLNEAWPGIVKDWRFILAGGSAPDNPYLARLREAIARSPAKNIELKVNLPAEELRTLYQESRLFWHLCGVVHDDPSEVEHFGMTVVEAMQNRLVPLVYDGGGLPEIVDHGLNGFMVKSGAELLEHSITLFKDPQLIQKLGEAAYTKAQSYSRAKFEERVRAFFDRRLAEYRQV